MKTAIIALLLATATQARADLVEAGEAISFLAPEKAGSYVTVTAGARELARAFFTRLKKAGLVADLLRANGGSFLPGVLFSKLHPVPQKEIDDCRAVFCRDVALQATLNEEMRRGRLVLVTNSFSGYVGAMIGETLETDALKKVLIPEVAAPPRNVLLVTPKTLLSTIEHERVHAEDEESGALKPLAAKLRALARAGKMTAENGKAVHQFAGEVRAYEKEMRYVVGHARATEYVAIDAEDGTSLEVRTQGKREFLLRRLGEIDLKVRQHYLPAFVKAMGDRRLRAKERRSILEDVRALLPSVGPYSFESLVASKIR